MIKPLQSITLKNDNGEDTTYVVASAPAIVETTEPASMASFADGAAGIPVKSLLADINPVQTGSGDPSPSNVRPITGWTGMNVYRTGVNQWDEALTAKYYWGYDESGEMVKRSHNDRSCSTNFIPVLPNTAYNAFHPNANINIMYIDGNGKYISSTNWQSASSTTSFTTPANARYIVFTLNANVTYNNDISINYPSTDHDYHAYAGTTYPISWADEAGTVYGGTLDVTTGLLTVTHALVTYSSKTGWAKASDFYYISTPNEYRVTQTPISNWLVGEAPRAYSGMENLHFAMSETFAYVNVRYNGLADIDAWGALLSANPLQILYKLATPQTYQLTPQAVMTILGQNNIWADTGDVEVAYCADTKMYIDKMISEL